MKVNAILLRAPDASSSPDIYESAFNSMGTQCSGVCIPVLETVLVNLDRLKEVILGEPKVDGVIMTSARSCEAWKTALGKLDRNKDAWSKMIFFVVGTSTALSLRDIYPGLSQIRGEHTGTAKQLAHFILEDLQESTRRKRLLYLTGDKNRDTLSRILNDGHIELEPLQVYGTCGNATFPAELGSALNELEKDAEFWIIFFAPSVAEFVYPHLQEHFRFRSADSGVSGSDHSPLARVAAIGPTTASFLQDNLRIEVDAVADKPNSDALVEAIRTYREELPANTQKY
ncbi:hypothetical protein D9757_006965 [Collybiopsis confluens]|uniref:Tetrapyrrole biosynthesis uroporphyrinogen III synthase domain-containing protein n=1 Tax=Collybiopsis confluens TaxID=2823264 RepID=A0A8H5M812_9AGAR|nr:hypothetical protein D9757_006965 [Collybiopsis confluens]